MGLLASLLIPNFNSDALIGLWVALAGIVLIILGYQIALVPKVGEWVRSIGALMFLGGLLYWFGLSAIQNILADTKLVVLICAAIFLVVFAIILFAPSKKGKRRR